MLIGRSRHAKSHSDEQEDPQDVLASPSLAIERESIKEDYLAPPADSVDSAIPDGSEKKACMGSTDTAGC